MASRNDASLMPGQIDGLGKTAIPGHNTTPQQNRDSSGARADSFLSRPADQFSDHCARNVSTA